MLTMIEDILGRANLTGQIQTFLIDITNSDPGPHDV